MNMVYKGFGLLKHYYNQLNPATLTGAIDILVVEQEDGSYISSPFHVRFGKLGVLRAKEKLVNIAVNGERIHDLHMKLGDQGEAFFVEEITEEEEEIISSRLITSPLPSRPSTPTERNDKHFDDYDENVLTFTTQSNEEFGKRKRRKKRKRRSLVQSTCSGIEGLKSMVDGGSHSGSGEEDISHFVERQEINVNSNLEERKISHSSVESFSDNNNNPDISSMRCVVSDSELPKREIERAAILTPFSDSEANENHSRSGVMWGWGQLPGRNEVGQDSSSDDSSHNNDDIKQKTVGSLNELHFRAIPSSVDSVQIIDEETSTNHNIYQVSPDTSHAATSNKSKKPKETNGLYLDDVLSLTPSEANLYLQTSPKTCKNNLTNIDTPDRAFSPGCSDADSGTDSQSPEEHCSDSTMDQHIPKVSISLCGFISGTNDVDQATFIEKIVNFDTFLQNPLTVLNDPNLVFNLGGRYFNWQVAAPLVVSLAVFKQPLSQECIERLVQPSQPSQQPSRLMGWLWRRPRPMKAETNKSSNDVISGPSFPSEIDHVTDQTSNSHQNLIKSYSEKEKSCKNDIFRERRITDTDIPETDITNILQPELKRSQSAQDIHSTTLPVHDQLINTNICGGKMMRKTTRLTSMQLESLNLKPGANKIGFSVTTQYQGTTRCLATVYLWKWSDKLVVSDIDGTITKSDVFGQILPVVGKDWTQGGVAQLFQKIGSNGYKFIYLSARAIGQASMTKGYLDWINQQGVSLPPGPLLLSPTSLMIAFRREVIEKKPEKFKIECLKDIKALFPVNPFAAGFGNKSSDVVAYTAVGVPSNRLFTINHKGELKHEELQTYTTSYCGLGEMVDNFFPPLNGDKDQEFIRAHDFSDFTYWREDIVDQFEDFRLA